MAKKNMASEAVGSGRLVGVLSAMAQFFVLSWLMKGGFEDRLLAD
jgi:hypothetical protein